LLIIFSKKNLDLKNEDGENKKRAPIGAFFY